MKLKININLEDNYLIYFHQLQKKKLTNDR